MRKDLFDSIRERMDGFEETAPDGLWDEIVSSVPARGGKRGKVVTLPWLWRSAGIAAAAAAVGLVLFLNRAEESSDTPTASVAEAAAKYDGKIIGVDVDQAPTIDQYAEGMTVTSAMKGLSATVNSALTAIVVDNTWSDLVGKIDNLGLVSGDDLSQQKIIKKHLNY